jgi:hypothetical protein
MKRGQRERESAYRSYGQYLEKETEVGRVYRLIRSIGEEPLTEGRVRAWL